MDSLIQFQADLFGKTIAVAADPESTVRGAAFLAGAEANVTDEASFHFLPIRKQITPRITSKKRACLIAAWKKVI